MKIFHVSAWLLAFLLWVLQRFLLHIAANLERQGLIRPPTGSDGGKLSHRA